MIKDIRKEIAENLRVYACDLTDEIVEEIKDLMYVEDLSVAQATEVYSSWANLTQSIEMKVSDLYDELIRDRTTLETNCYNISVLSEVLCVIDGIPQSFVVSDDVMLNIINRPADVGAELRFEITTENLVNYLQK